MRKTIRAAIVSRLKAASTAAGDRVYPSRVHNLFGTTYPVINVYTTGLTYDRIGQQPSAYRKTIAIEVQGITGEVGTDSEDAADDLMDEIEASLLVDDNLGIEGIESIDAESAEIQLFETGDRDYTSVVFRFNAHYLEEIEPAGSDEEGLQIVEFPYFDGEKIVTKP